MSMVLTEREAPAATHIELPSPENTIVLFNLHNTLVRETGREVHREAIEEGLQNVFHVKLAPRPEEMAGRTDRGMIKTSAQLYEAEGVTDKRIDEALPVEAKYFEEHVAEGGYQINYGAGRLLDELRRERYGIGIVSGNPEAVGGAKMQGKPRLEQAIPKQRRYWGDKFYNRTDLLAHAVQDLGENGITRVVYVGQSPRDVEAAREVGVESIAVKAGKHKEDALRRADPDLYVASFKYPQRQEIVSFLKRK